MNVAIFGGTFDPIHNGHLAVARAARDTFGLKLVYFVPAATPPHKVGDQMTDYEHRYAMVALATAGEKEFVPSLIEAPSRRGLGQPSYSIETVRQVKAGLSARDRLFFIAGIDAFLGIAKWREPEALLSEVEFIVASRPGFSLADVGGALPESLRPKADVLAALRKSEAVGDIVLPGVTIHLLANLKERAAATNIRAAAAGKRSYASLLPSAVAEYIKKSKLYKNEPARPGRAKVLKMPRTRVSVGTEE